MLRIKAATLNIQKITVLQKGNDHCFLTFAECQILQRDDTCFEEAMEVYLQQIIGGQMRR